MIFQVEANKNLLCSWQTNNVTNKIINPTLEETAKKVTTASGVIRTASEMKNTIERKEYKMQEKKRNRGPPPPEMSQQDEPILNVIGSTGVEEIIGDVHMAEEKDDLETMSARSETSSVKD